MNPTGVSADEIVYLATALYNGVNFNDAKNDCGKPFRFRLAWDVSLTHAKFMPAGNGDVGQSSAESSLDELGDSNNSGTLSTKNEKSAERQRSETHPVGKKKAKKEDFKVKQKEKQLSPAAEAVAVKREKQCSEVAF
ncbi:hypothetical protein BWQ96_08153 [Gracilariopsis chorda]|uniref:Uncharacterized protein n=1 Tax=Gracilariopsis chorda TaxID=448386 RepID=A0A2V3IJ78_9FLOR|nr:hypothetical protein BWQ96_08153 [Gracilariopsis chorda]|eukprot:PXF42121.1 hypothetical protein BWQ96_08153 [Gracilariopsis chorda]